MVTLAIIPVKIKLFRICLQIKRELFTFAHALEFGRLDASENKFVDQIENVYFLMKLKH